MKPNAYRFEVVIHTTDTDTAETFIDRMVNGVCPGRDAVGREACTCEVDWEGTGTLVYVDADGDIHE